MKKIIFLLSVTLILFILFSSCNQEKNKLDLITIDRILYSGMNIRFFIGYDSVGFYQALENNQISLNVVDSYFVFIISKKAFDHLKLFAIDENQAFTGRHDINDIARRSPVITRFCAYNKRKVNETYCLQPECNDIYEKFVVALNFEKDLIGDSLVNSLKKKAFCK